jgi:hypothetical protein
MVGGSLVSGVMGASAANKAADAQTAAADASIEEQRRQFDLTREDYEPYRQSGINALAAMNYEMGLGPRPGTAPQVISGGTGATQDATGQAAGASGQPATDGRLTLAGRGFERDGQARVLFDGMPAGTVRSQGEFDLMQAMLGAGGQQQAQGAGGFFVGDQRFDTMDEAQQFADSMGGTEYRGFQATPGYQFAVDEAQKGLERSAAARGIRMSGATLDAAQDQRLGMANQEYGTYYNRLAGLAGTGQTATNSLANIGASTSANIGNALIGAGQARASGYQGQNAAFQNTLNNFGSTLGYAQSGMFGPSPGFGITPNPAGLKAYGY